MKKMHAIQVISDFDKKGRFVFTKHDLAMMFSEDNLKALEEGLNRLVKAGILGRACKGIYVNAQARSVDSYLIEHIAKTLRRGEYNYISLESALSEYGLISQIPIHHLTVMTTGRSGIYKTLYGVIEFTHTKRPVASILSSMHKVEKRPLRIATKETAIRDLKRVGRNVHLLREKEEEEDGYAH
jgi:predicted transcriptional regulator of viral defense system